MEFKEAPAPWLVDSDEALKVKDSDGCTVATISQLTLRKRRHAKEAHQIAQAIAAVPEMIAALMAIKMYMSADAEEYGPDDAAYKAWTMLEDALSRALTPEEE